MLSSKMNIFFLTLVRIEDIEERGIYQDLMRKFRDEGHSVYIVTPCERRTGLVTSLIEINGVKILNVKTLNIVSSNIVEKGIGTLLIERQFKLAVKEYLKDIVFDLILYSTPPVTFSDVLKSLKNENPKAISYLLLKDIFPQNAVDLKLFGKKSLFYWYFRREELNLYKVSDFIGCLSPANVEYVLKHTPEVSSDRIEVAPNSIEILPNLSLADERAKRQTERNYMRSKYNLPLDKPVFIYGGNLGKPQGISYLIECLDANANREDCYFLVIGTGTELPKLIAWYEETHHKSFKVMKGLPKEEYDMLVRSCDVGLIFLDYRLTVPCYPSRLLSYLENKMPVLCATDAHTDIGKIAEENGYGYWCESVKPEDFTALVDKMLAADRKAMGERGYEFLKKNYLVEHTYNAIIKHFG